MKTGRKSKKRRLIWMREEHGEGLFQVIAALGLAAMLLGIAANDFVSISSRSHDIEIKNSAEQSAVFLTESIVTELRLAGSGMPLGQSDFTAYVSGFSDLTLPLLPSSGEKKITFRANTNGVSTVLTKTFKSNSGDRRLKVYDSTGFGAGDSIYVSDLPGGGKTALAGTVLSVSRGVLELDSTYYTTIDAEFAPGSTVNRVSTITYESTGGSKGIVRTDERGEIPLADGSMFTVQYLDQSGSPVKLPLTGKVVSDKLGGIRIDVYVPGNAPLKDGTPFIAHASRTAAFRNLILNRAL